MTKAPYARAAFINAIADEGTKDEAVQFLQETWNELCECRARLDAVEKERDQAIIAMSEQARKRGEAEGALAASEMAGIVRGWMI